MVAAEARCCIVVYLLINSLIITLASGTDVKLLIMKYYFVSVLSVHVCMSFVCFIGMLFTVTTHTCMENLEMSAILTGISELY